MPTTYGWSLAGKRGGVGVVGLECLEPYGRQGASSDDPESCGGVEQARLQDVGLPVLALGVAATVGDDDVDAGETSLARGSLKRCAG